MSESNVEIDLRLRALQGTLSALRRQASELGPRAERAQQAARRLGQPVASIPGVNARHALRDRIDELEKELDGLRTAMRTRAVIEQAKGMVMQREHVDDDAAFEVLKRASQRSHVRLYDVAEQLVLRAVHPEERTPLAGR